MEQAAYAAAERRAPVYMPSMSRWRSATDERGVMDKVIVMFLG